MEEANVGGYGVGERQTNSFTARNAKGSPRDCNEGNEGICEENITRRAFASLAR